MDIGISKDKQVNKENSTKVTTVKLSETTKHRLDHLKLYPRETYDEIAQRLLDILNLTMKNPQASRARLINLDKQRKRNFKEVK